MAVVIEGLESLIKKLDKMNGNLKGALTRAIQQTVQTAEKEAEVLKPYASIRIQSNTKVTPDGIEGKVFSVTPYAAYVEFGTGPKGQADHAGISPNVPVTYTQHSWVYHSEDYGFVTTSGQPARPYLYPTAKQVEPVMGQYAKNELLKEIMRAGG